MFFNLRNLFLLPLFILFAFSTNAFAEISLVLSPYELNSLSEDQIQRLAECRVKRVCQTDTSIEIKYEEVEDYYSEGCHLKGKAIKITAICPPRSERATTTISCDPRGHLDFEKTRTKLQEIMRFAPSGSYHPSKLEGLNEIDHQALIETSEYSFLNSDLISALTKIDDFNSYFPEEIDRLESFAGKPEGLTQHELKKIIEAKKLWVDILHGIGSYFDLTSFGNQHPGIRVLQRLLKLQSPQIDGAIDEDLIEDYLRARNGKPYRTLISGAGPIGLLLALKQFAAGSDVNIIEMRSEIYSRSHSITVRRNILAQLTYLLGTKFDPLFLGNHRSYLQCQGPYEIGRIPVNLLEDALKIRVSELISRIQAKLPYTPVQLDYKMKFEFLDESGTVMIGQGLRIPMDQPFDIFDRSGEFKSGTHYDMIVFAGGSNDLNREKYLGPVTSKTRTDYLMHAVWSKTEKIAEKNIFSNELFPMQVLTLSDLFDSKSDSILNEIGAYVHTAPETSDLLKRRFSRVISTYNELKDKMASQTINVVYLSESKEEATAGYLFPTSFGEWLSQDLEALASGETTTTPLKRLIFDFKKYLLDQTVTLTIDKILKDEHPTNVIIPLTDAKILIPVLIKSPKNGVKVFDTGRSKVIVTAVGDANVSADYRMGFGLVVGELSALDVVSATKRFIELEERDKNPHWWYILHQLDRNLARDRQLALEFATYKEPIESTKALTTREQIDLALGSAERLLEVYSKDEIIRKRGFYLDKANGFYSLRKSESTSEPLGSISITPNGQFEFRDVNRTGFHRFDTIEEILFRL